MHPLHSSIKLRQCNKGCLPDDVQVTTGPSEGKMPCECIVEDDVVSGFLLSSSVHAVHAVYISIYVGMYPWYFILICTTRATLL